MSASGDAGRVVDTDVAAGRVERAGDGPADLSGGEVDAVAEEPGRAHVAAKVAAGTAATAIVAMRADAEARLTSRRLVMKDME